MAEFIHDDIVEQILIGLDANVLVRYKRVCKSWQTLITSPRFVRRHLNRSYNKDCCSNELAHRRITIYTNHDSIYGHLLVGSSNGLVCIYSDSIMNRLIVGNPLTREVRQLKYPPWIGVPLCWGFGYDSSRDDYKVIVGARKSENQICVRMLTLKSNVWRVIGELKYKRFITKDGILCNSALHWIIHDQNPKIIIISYDLSTDEFKEIPQPEAAMYNFTHSRFLGIAKGLCIFGYSKNVWLMKKYNLKDSWERLQHDRETKKDIVHFLRLKLPKNNDASWFFRSEEHLCWEYMDAHRYVQSLVSPHVNASSMLSKQKKPHVALMGEDPGSASSILMKKMIFYTFILLLTSILFLPLMFREYSY